MSKLNFPIPCPNQQPNDDLAAARSILNLVIKVLEERIVPNAPSDTDIDLVVALESVREQINPIIRFLNRLDAPDLLDLYSDCRRQEIVRVGGER